MTSKKTPKPALADVSSDPKTPTTPQPNPTPEKLPALGKLDMDETRIDYALQGFQEGLPKQIKELRAQREKNQHAQQGGKVH